MDITIIVPAYNVENFIAKTITCLHRQNFSADRYEVIIVNDGSTDRTQGVVESHIASLKNFRLINQTNSGVSAARNTGIEHARGTYLLFLDGDDRIQENILERSLHFINQNNLELAHFNIIDERDEKSNNPDDEITANSPCITGAEYYLKFRRSGNARDTACTTFFKRELLNAYNIRFTEQARYLEDGEFLAKTFAVAKRCQGSLYPLYLRTIRPGSATNTSIYKRRNVIYGIVESAYSLKEFRDRFVNEGEGLKVMNQAIIKFVTLSLMLLIRRFDFRAYLNLFREYQAAGLKQLKAEGVTLNFPRLAEAYNKGWLSMLAYTISVSGPILKIKRALSLS